MSIELKNVTKQFGQVAAVNGVSFSVREGELMALLGPSGGGKTTVLRMIAGLEVPTTGDVFIRGTRVNDLSVQERNIGFVFQNYALFKNMNVFKNIAFGLKIKKWKRSDIKARVAELLKLFSLEGLDKRYPHQLSGGQRQRVAIARALASQPTVLLLDEPFGAVDAKIRQELREWLVKLHHDLNVTTIFVTHDQEEALEVSNRIVIFSRGHECFGRRSPKRDRARGGTPVSRRRAAGRHPVAHRVPALRRADFQRSTPVSLSRRFAAHFFSGDHAAAGI
jgi:sulfate transport system ATP-binding protein